MSMGFFRQEHWSGLPFPSPANLPDPGIEPMSLALQADSLALSHQTVIIDIYILYIYYISFKKLYIYKL